MRTEIIKEYFEQENGIDKIYMLHDGKNKKLIKEIYINGDIKTSLEAWVCVDTEKEKYIREMKEIKLIRENLKKYPYLVILHINDYNILIKNKTEKNNLYHEDIVISIKNEVLKDVISPDIKKEKIKNNKKIFLDQEDIINTKNNHVQDKHKNGISNDDISAGIEDNNHSDCNNINLLRLRKNNESKNILNKTKKDYYLYYNRFLPERKNEIEIIFKNINTNIKTQHKTKADTIIQYYEIFKSFKLSCINISSNSFYNYIDYNNKEYCFIYYNNKQFYNKVKKCYDFIDFFTKQNICFDNIFNILQKTNLSYTKLFKITMSDYEELKQFFLEKLNLISKIKIRNIVKMNNEIIVKT